MTKRHRPSEETKIRRAEMRARRNALRQQVRRALLNKMQRDAIAAAKSEG